MYMQYIYIYINITYAVRIKDVRNKFDLLKGKTYNISTNII